MSYIRVCTVFHRRSRGTNLPVKLYGEFIEYLLDIDRERIKAVELDFDGKNVLLYSLGPCVALVDPATEQHHVVKGAANGKEHWWKMSENKKVVV